MQRIEPVEHRLSDYTVPDFLIEHVNLEINLTETPARVTSQLVVKPNPEHKSSSDALTLDGENMKLRAISVNGKALAESDYELTSRSLTIKTVPATASFTIETEADLGDNPDLFGLYKTEGTYLVKAETEGMRRVIFCKDRPDVLSTYKTTIIANAEFPTLLSNGEPLSIEKLPNDSKPTPSLLRDFSAPVRFNYAYTQDDLLFLLQHDTNLFNRTEAAKELMLGIVKTCLDSGVYAIDDKTTAVLSGLLQDETLNPWIVSIMLSVPAETTLAQSFKQYDLDALLAARESLMRAIAMTLAPEFLARLEMLSQQQTTAESSLFDVSAACNRRLKNLCLSYLSKVLPDKVTETSLKLFRQSLKTNMTDTMNSLELLMSLEATERYTALNEFYEYWRNDTSAMNNWFKIQAGANASTTVQTVESLLSHPAFDLSNPNKVLALLTPFTSNTTGFHEKSGKGYALYTRILLQLEAINPTLAARLVEPLGSWSDYNEARQVMMHDQLIELSRKAKSDSLIQAVSKALEKPFTVQRERVAAGLLAWMQPAVQKPQNLVEEIKPATSLALKPT